MRRSILVLGLTIGLGALLAACDGAPERDVKRVVVALGADDGSPDGARPFKDRIERGSNDAMQVEIDVASRLCGDPAACLRALEVGDIDVFQTTVDSVAPHFPELQVLDLPYLFETDAVVERVFAGPFAARMRDAIVYRSGFRLMALTNAGWRGLATTRRGTRMPVEIGRLRRLTGDSEITHVTLDHHSVVAGLWLMSDDAYHALPADLREVVRGAFGALKEAWVRRSTRKQDAEVAAFEAAGGRVGVPTSAEKRALVMAAGGVTTGYVEEHGHEWLVALEGAIAEAEREIALEQGAR